MPARAASTPVSDDDGSADILLELRRIQERASKQCTDAKKAVLIKAKKGADMYERQVNEAAHEHERAIEELLARHDEKENSLKDEIKRLLDELADLLTDQGKECMALVDCAELAAKDVKAASDKALNQLKAASKSF